MTTREAVQINRDSFARESLMRAIDEQGECRWCGQPARYYYFWESDNYRRGRMDGPFCSVGCYRTHQS